MTKNTIVEPLCLRCLHYWGFVEGKHYCAAFEADGIPQPILQGEVSHMEPYEGDGGTVFAEMGEFEEPEKSVGFVEAIKQLGDRLEQSLVNRPQIIQVEMPKPKKQFKRVVRDETGKIDYIVEGEIDDESDGERMQ